jgi:hypothetical protein
MEFLLKLMRMGHTILGITAPPPEHERAYLLLWTLSLTLFLHSALAWCSFLCLESCARASIFCDSETALL